MYSGIIVFVVCFSLFMFFVKQKTAYELRISDWSSDVCSSDLPLPWCDGRCVQDPGTYSPRHADPRLLAIPTSCRRVAACNPDYDRVSGIGSPSRVGDPLSRPLYDV